MRRKNYMVLLPNFLNTLYLFYENAIEQKVRGVLNINFCYNSSVKMIPVFVHIKKKQKKTCFTCKSKQGKQHFILEHVKTQKITIYDEV